MEKRGNSISGLAGVGVGVVKVEEDPPVRTQHGACSELMRALAVSVTRPW